MIEEAIDTLTASLTTSKLKELRLPTEQTIDKVNESNQLSDMTIDSTVNSYQNVDETRVEDNDNEEKRMQDTNDDVDKSQMNETSRMALIDIMDAGRTKIKIMHTGQFLCMFDVFEW